MRIFLMLFLLDTVLFIPFIIDHYLSRTKLTPRNQGKIFSLCFIAALIIFGYLVVYFSEGSPYILFSNDGPLGVSNAAWFSTSVANNHQYNFVAALIILSASIVATFYYLDFEEKEFWIIGSYYILIVVIGYAGFIIKIS